jgi:hypothetical protein
MHVVQYSGGISSWAVAREVIHRHGPNRVVLLFADTLVEDPDLYRFLEDSTAQFGIPLTRVADGRTPFEVFWDQKFLGNSRVAPCSYILKQLPCRQWLKENADPDDTVVYVGIGESEKHRTPAITTGWAPWKTLFPLLGRPGLTPEVLREQARALGLDTPVMYDQGFAHNNCGGLCVRGGHAHWRRVLRIHPDRFAQAEHEEKRFREAYGDVSILKDRRGGQTRPLPLTDFRRRFSGTY